MKINYRIYFYMLPIGALFLAASFIDTSAIYYKLEMDYLSVFVSIAVLILYIEFCHYQFINWYKQDIQKEIDEAYEEGFQQGTLNK